MTLPLNPHPGPQPDDLTDASASAPYVTPNASLSTTHDTITTTTSESLKKTSSRWTENEVTLLLDYVEGNCILTTVRGISLKKSDFNKAHTMVKSKDASQCHYEWGRVCIVIIISFHH